MITSFVTNVAAVSVAFPIALSVTQSLNADTTPFFLAIAFAASAAFLTPFGYQTNWLVYGPGGYKPRDFFKVGLPLLVVYSVAVIGYLSLYYHMY
jgi:di/tricarboxylate transporter